MSTYFDRLAQREAVRRDQDVVLAGLVGVDRDEGSLGKFFGSTTSELMLVKILKTEPTRMS